MTFELINAIVWDGSEKQIKDFFQDRFESFDPTTNILTLTDDSTYYLDKLSTQMICLDGKEVITIWLPSGCIREVEQVQPLELKEQTIEDYSQLTELDNRLLTLIEDGFQKMITKI